MSRITLLLVLFCSFSIFAENSTTDFSGHLQTRYDKQDGKDIERMQDTIVLRLKSNLSDIIKIESLIQNNPNYGVKYHTYHNFNKDEWTLNDQRFAFKQLFISKKLSRLTLQLGALKAVDELGGHTAFGNNSWVDGFRAIHELDDNYKLSLTVGSLNDLNVDIGSRDRVLNHFELHLRYKESGASMIEGSIGMIDKEEFFRIANTKTLKIFQSKIMKLGSEILVNFQDGLQQLSSAISGEFDLLNFINHNHSGIDLLLQYSYGEPDIGLRGQVNDDRYMDDYNFQVGLAKAFGVSEQFKLEGLVDFRDDNRYQFSFRYDF